MSRQPTPDILGEVLAATVVEEVRSASSVAIASIRTDGGTQPREGLDHPYIRELAESLDNGATLPPVDVMYDGKDYWLYDGFHRLEAHKAINRVMILAKVHQGDQAAAQWESYAANQNHGLRRSPGDKERAIRAALRHPKGVALSDSLIAKHLGVSDKTVTRYRGMMESASEIPKVTERQGADGKTYKTANIGANRPAGARADVALKQPQRPAEVWELERLLAGWAKPLHVTVLRSTANMRSGGMWWDARQVLQQGGVNYRDRDLVSALHNLASQKEQRVDASPIAQTIAPTPAVVVSAESGREGEGETPTAESGSEGEGETPAGKLLVDWTEEDWAAYGQGGQDGQAAAVEVVTERGVELVTPEEDDRHTRLRRWWVRLMSLQNDLLDWGDLTGRHLATGETERGLRRMLEITQRELDCLEGRVVAEVGEDVV